MGDSGDSDLGVVDVAIMKDKLTLLLAALFTAFVFMLIGAVLMSHYLRKPEIVEPKKVFYSVHYPDAKGWRPMPFTDRDRISRIKGVRVAEFPTLYYVLIFPDGEVKDGGIEHMQWYRK